MEWEEGLEWERVQLSDFLRDETFIQLTDFTVSTLNAVNCVELLVILKALLMTGGVPVLIGNEWVIDDLPSCSYNMLEAVVAGCSVGTVPHGYRRGVICKLDVMFAE